jgi:hypothetical protein
MSNLKSANASLLYYPKTNNDRNQKERLISDWKKTYNNSPPKGLSLHTLELASTHNKQAQNYGRLAKTTINQLIKIVKLDKNKVQPSSFSLIRQHIQYIICRLISCITNCVDVDFGCLRFFVRTVDACEVFEVSSAGFFV